MQVFPSNNAAQQSFAVAHVIAHQCLRPLPSNAVRQLCEHTHLTTHQFETFKMLGAHATVVLSGCTATVCINMCQQPL